MVSVVSRVGVVVIGVGERHEPERLRVPVVVDGVDLTPVLVTRAHPGRFELPLWTRRLMGVYVDEPIYQRYGMRWCHLTADSGEELHAFAARLGLRRSRFQTKPGRPWVDHYDLTEETRREAVALGAVEVTIKEMGAQLARKRNAARGAPRS